METVENDLKVYSPCAICAIRRWVLNIFLNPFRVILNLYPNWHETYKLLPIVNNITREIQLSNTSRSFLIIDAIFSSKLPKYYV